MLHKLANMTLFIHVKSVSYWFFMRQSSSTFSSLFWIHAKFDKWTSITSFSSFLFLFSSFSSFSNTLHLPIPLTPMSIVETDENSFLLSGLRKCFTLICERKSHLNLNGTRIHVTKPFLQFSERYFAKVFWWRKFSKVFLCVSGNLSLLPIRSPRVADHNKSS